MTTDKPVIPSPFPPDRPEPLIALQTVSPTTGEPRRIVRVPIYSIISCRTIGPSSTPHTEVVVFDPSEPAPCVLIVSGSPGDICKLAYDEGLRRANQLLTEIANNTKGGPRVEA